jgi:hypothetical protein
MPSFQPQFWLPQPSQLQLLILSLPLLSACSRPQLFVNFEREPAFGQFLSLGLWLAWPFPPLANLQPLIAA